MKRLLGPLLVLPLFLVGAPTARADFILSLSSPTPDLTHLQVGQAVTFNVNLSGLNSGDALAYLAGTVVFDATLLGTPTSVPAGAIVPDASGFLGTGFSGAADAFYDAIFFSSTNARITTNGTFFAFDVTV
jgi:hypothetical protein